MIAFVDVDYRKVGAVAAAVLATKWTDATPTAEVAAFVPTVADYVPGEFYGRELPCLQAVLAQCPMNIQLIVIDGYVWIGPARPGLGAKLLETLGRSIPIVGVGKTAFKSAEPVAIKMHRCGSRQPLWITAIGVSTPDAADSVRSMHGQYRIPTLIRRADRVARTAAAE